MSRTAFSLSCLICLTMVSSPSAAAERKSGARLGRQSFTVRVPARISVRQTLVGPEPCIGVSSTASIAATLRTSKSTTTAPALHAPLPVPGVPQQLTLSLPTAANDDDLFILTIVPLD